MMARQEVLLAKDCSASNFDTATFQKWSLPLSVNRNCALTFGSCTRTTTPTLLMLLLLLRHRQTYLAAATLNDCGWRIVIALCSVYNLTTQCRSSTFVPQPILHQCSLLRSSPSLERLIAFVDLVQTSTSIAFTCDRN